MSVESWTEEFYPIDAQAFAEWTDNPLELTEHALRKWKGFLPENLEKHEILYGPALPCSNDCFSCALCEVFYSGDNGYDCIQCPLFKLRNEKCYKNASMSPKVYTGETDINGFPCNPEVMVEALENTIKMLKGDTDEY